jgi:hypothetical protein
LCKFLGRLHDGSIHAHRRQVLEKRQGTKSREVRRAGAAGVLGQPVVPNGIPLSKIHHAAFDVHLIGIDPDYRLHVSKRAR